MYWEKCRDENKLGKNSFKKENQFLISRNNFCSERKITQR